MLTYDHNFPAKIFKPGMQPFPNENAALTWAYNTANSDVAVRIGEDLHNFTVRVLKIVNIRQFPYWEFQAINPADWRQCWEIAYERRLGGR